MCFRSYFSPGRTEEHPQNHWHRTWIQSLVQNPWMLTEKARGPTRGVQTEHIRPGFLMDTRTRDGRVKRLDQQCQTNEEFKISNAAFEE